MSRNFSYIRKTDKGIEAYNGSKWISLKINDVVETTYKQLKKWKNKGKLDPYTWYLIKDFQTIHIIPNSYNPNYNNGEVTNKDEADVNEGPVEPILVQAASNTNLFEEAYSLEFPQDVLYYDIEGKNLFDEHIPSSGNKGWIYRRINYAANFDISEDWRGVKYRRWRIGSNSLGLPERLYCLWSDSIKIGWDENITVNGNDGFLTINAADTSDYIDVLMFNNRRDPFPHGRYWDFEMFEDQELYSLSNTCYIYDNSDPYLDDREGCLDIHLSPNSAFSTRLRQNTLLGNEVKGIRVTEGFFNNIISVIHSNTPGFTEAGEIRNSVITLHQYFGKKFNHAPKVGTISDSLILSHIQYSFNSWGNTPGHSPGIMLRGFIDKCVFKHTDGNGDVVNLVDTNPYLTQCLFENLQGFHFTKLADSVKSTIRSKIINYPPINNQGEAYSYFNYIVDSEFKDVYIDRYEGKSNYRITKPVSSNEVSLTTPESKVAGYISVDTSSSAQTVDKVSGSPEHVYILQPSSSNNSLTINHNPVSDGIYLPSGDQSGGITLSNSMDFVRLRYNPDSGFSVVELYQTY